MRPSIFVLALLVFVWLGAVVLIERARVSLPEQVERLHRSIP